MGLGSDIPLPWQYEYMAIARWKITAQGQISVPGEVRRKPGVGPGSILEWDEDGGRIVVHRAGRFTSGDIHRAVFSARTIKAGSLDDLKEGVRRYVRRRYARD
jgi:AbrB family looped-hinge helix DNA binding protein